MNLWEHKYRPTSFGEYVFQSNELKNAVNELISKGEIPNLLLSGVQGTGKSSFAECLVNDFSIEPSDVLRLNASKDNGIDQVRTRITDFCQTFPLGRMKIVIFEEADRLTDAAQKALREPIERFADTVRFIFTCNYPHKILPAIHSRLRHIEFNAFDEDALLDRAAMVLEQENIRVDSIDTLIEHVRAYAPDLRKILVSLQQSSVNGVLGPVAALGDASEFDEQWKAAWVQPRLSELLPVAQQGVDNNNYEFYYRTMYESVENLPESIRPAAVVTIAEHLYKAMVVADQEINLVACLYKIFGDYS